PTSSTEDSSPTPSPLDPPPRCVKMRAREGTAGRLNNPARSTCPRTSTLRISHFPDPHTRRYADPTDPERPNERRPYPELRHRLLSRSNNEVPRSSVTHTDGRVRLAPCTRKPRTVWSSRC